MDVGTLKQAEVFAFLAALFLIAVVLTEKQRLENPPIIILSEENKAFRFQSGSAEVPSAFVLALRDRIVPEIDRLSRKYQCDSIEIIGHTDSVPVKKNLSTMDAVSDSLSGAMPGSNVDLGMMRAISVMRLFKEAKTTGRLSMIKYIIPYSGGQLILPNRALSWGFERNGNNARRRIEVRLLRSTQTHHIDF